MYPEGSSRFQKVLAAFSVRLTLLILLVAIASAGYSQSPARIATDYEWQLSQPGRTLFRDRLPVGQIALVAGKKEKATGEVLQMLTDIAFMPGDSNRFFAVAIRVGEGDRVFSEVLADAEELPELIRSARYIGQTARDIASTERAETNITFHTRAGFSLEFVQAGTRQQISVALPDPFSDGEIIRDISLDQLSLFADLLDLTIFELNRQGAGLKVKSNK